MNIKEAKKQIKNAMIAYFSKDEFGNYLIPVQKQRPVFLIGPPGIGKTAIMEQIARSMKVSLVSYSITHHTRQSALGLPFITEKIYDGKEYRISEYTMSEIIASVYDTIEKTGNKEGILFLDEINCVSETLSPAMLQFLQYKIFGKHRVPEGWIVVTAGNPPEYNKNVHEMDIVTLDRLKRVDVEPDYQVWRSYAVNRNLHSSILNFLDQKPEFFYSVTTSIDGKSFVTPRGWEDLSDMMRLYELHDIQIDYDLEYQYLQNSKIAREFATYYELFNRYKKEYQIESIFSGEVSESLMEKAKESSFDERLAVVGMLLDEITAKIRKVNFFDRGIQELRALLKQAKGYEGKELQTKIQEEKRAYEEDFEQKKTAGSLNNEELYAKEFALNFLTGSILEEQNFSVIQKAYMEKVAELKELIAHTNTSLQEAFRFIEQAYDGDQEMVLFVTELTVRSHCSYYISRYGSEEYFKYNKELLLEERKMDLKGKISELEL